MENLLELKCKYNIHNYPDKVSVDLLDNNKIMLSVSKMRGHYLTSSALMDIDEVEILRSILNIVIQKERRKK